MAWTQTHLDALEAAIARGTRSVTYDGERVEYHSLADMLQLRAIMRADLGYTSATGAKRYAIFNPGT